MGYLLNLFFGGVVSFMSFSLWGGGGVESFFPNKHVSIGSGGGGGGVGR